MKINYWSISKKKYGNQWTKIARELGRDKTEVKGRFQTLKQRMNNNRLESIVPLRNINELPFEQWVFGDWNPPGLSLPPENEQSQSKDQN